MKVCAVKFHDNPSRGNGGGRCGRTVGRDIGNRRVLRLRKRARLEMDSDIDLPWGY
jgi:hypothetical protein